MKVFLALAIAASFLILDTAQAGWVRCAQENGHCNFQGTKQVRYGTNSGNRWAYLTFTNGVSCNNSTFGDPAYGIVKACDYYEDTPVNWRFCANENGYCDFTGLKRVRYGANGRYNYKTIEDGINCNNSVFGDPLYGVGKKCEIQIAP